MGLVLGKLVVIAAGAEAKVADIEHVGGLVNHGQRKGLSRCDYAGRDIFLVHGNRDARRGGCHLHCCVDNAAGTQPVCHGAHHVQATRHGKERSFVHNDHSPNSGLSLMDVCTHKKGDAHTERRL